jgi:hypothetical protein
MTDDFLIENEELIASFAHLSYRDMDVIELTSITSDASFIKIADTTKDFITAATIDEGLGLLYLFAESLGCKKIRFILDGPTYEGIPTYE